MVGHYAPKKGVVAYSMELPPSFGTLNKMLNILSYIFGNPTENPPMILHIADLHSAPEVCGGGGGGGGVK